MAQRAPTPGHTRRKCNFSTRNLSTCTEHHPWPTFSVGFRWYFTASTSAIDYRDDKSTCPLIQALVLFELLALFSLNIASGSLHHFWLKLSQGAPLLPCQ